MDGAKVSKQAIKDYVNGAETAEEIGKLNIKINNDDVFAQEINSQIDSKILETQIDSRVSDVNDRNKLVDLEKQRQQAEASRLKDEAYRERVQATYGRRDRASLLAGGKGGRGFEIERGLLSKDTLGA